MPKSQKVVGVSEVASSTSQQVEFDVEFGQYNVVAVELEPLECGHPFFNAILEP